MPLWEGWRVLGSGIVEIAGRLSTLELAGCVPDPLALYVGWGALWGWGRDGVGVVWEGHYCAYDLKSEGKCLAQDRVVCPKLLVLGTVTVDTVTLGTLRRDGTMG